MPKQYKVVFYAGEVGAAGQEGRVSEFLSQLHETGNPVPHVMSSGDVDYFIKDLVPVGNRGNFRGVFGKLRMSDIPHIGDHTGAEREVALRANEGMIEKNHFLYFRRDELLVYQVNSTGSTVNTFAEYFTDYCGTTTSFHPVIKPEAIRRFMRGNTDVRKLELTVARPANRALFPDDNFSQELLGIMNRTQSASVHIKLSANRPGQQGNVLARLIKAGVRNLARADQASVARVWVEEDGDMHVIDLVADRVSAKVMIEMNGRYPETESMFRGLEAARQEVLQDLKDYFGENHDALH